MDHHLGQNQTHGDGGVVLRKGSWRPTTAHEYIFMMTKTNSYYVDGEAVRESAEYGRKFWNDPSGTLRRAGGDPDRVLNGDARWRGNDPSAGRNLRTVWD